MYSIYKIINKVNNKIYVGQTLRPIEKRFNRHICDALNNKLDTHFARAIRKYGKHNFEIKLIETVSNQNELTIREKYWIDTLKTCNSDYGYNESEAGYKCGGNTYYSKTKNEMLSIAKKISNSKIGTKNPNHKAVKCLNIKTNEELHFSTVKECQEYFGEVHHRFITTRVLKKTKSAYNKQWLIAYENEDYLLPPKDRIKVINIITNEEHSFRSLLQASEMLNISYSSLKKHTKDNCFEIGDYKFLVLLN